MAAGGATAVGINCIGGPSALVPIVQQLAVVSPLPVMARPNAGYPRLVDGRPVYDLRPAWMAKQAKLYCDAGVRMIGGCCGIGPAHIAAVAQALEDHAPATVELPPDDATQTILPGRPAAGLGHCEVIALLPGGLEPTDVIRAGKALVGAGINCLGLDGGWPGSPDPCGMPSRIRHLQDVSGAQGVLCLTAGAVDLRSAQQACQAADLLGIDRVLIDDGIFGGGGPAAGRATTEQLVRLIADLNAGYDAAGNRISCAGAFTIGVRLPVERIGRAHQLADAGAHFATIQPVYDPKDFREAMHAYDAKLPLLAEVLVLTDADTAEALDNEVPALQVPDNLVERLRFDPDEDIHGVLRFLGHWRDRLAGVCLVLPDARTEAAVAVANGLPRPA